MVKQLRRAKLTHNDESARFVQAAKDVGADMLQVEFDATLRESDLKLLPEDDRPSVKNSRLRKGR